MDLVFVLFNNYYRSASVTKNKESVLANETSTRARRALVLPMLLHVKMATTREIFPLLKSPILYIVSN